MNDPTDDPTNDPTDDPTDVSSNDSIDALLSADLDGEASRVDHDRIVADPTLQSRQEELRSASRLAGEAPGPLPSAQVEDAINRALDEAAAAEIDEPAPGRTSRHRAQQGGVPWLVAAAVVLLAAIGLGLIITDKSPSRRAQSTSGAMDGRRKEAAPLSSTAPPSTPSAAGSTRLGFLGDYASAASLRSELTATVPPARRNGSRSPAPPLSSGQADRCATVVEARNPQLSRSNRLTVVSATIAGAPVLVLEYRAASVRGGAHRTTRVIALGAAACDERIDFER
ncbi:MAG: hypothetical protein M3Z46_00695 [Actinomycetota bacterium]|nr:hypothetical protein [Actinomycetota bacterium]